MKEDDSFEMPKGDFIPGIYNYCDAWCERCLYTDKCMNYASRKLMAREFEEDKRRKELQEKNQDFWKQVNTIVEAAAEIIDEEIPLEPDINLLFPDDDWDEDAEEAMKDHKKLRDKAKNHILSKVASKYEKAVEKWFLDRKEILKTESHTEKYSLRVSYPGITDEGVLRQLADSVELVSWYHIQIWIKMQRAVTGYFEEEEDPGFFEEFSLDDHVGSAFVVLLGVDRSIAGWNTISKHLKAESESVKPLLRMLLWMRSEVEIMFPGARSFVWPPVASD
jgi:hypothetical protein